MVLEFDLMYNVLKFGLDSIGWAHGAGDREGFEPAS